MNSDPTSSREKPEHIMCFLKQEERLDYETLSLDNVHMFINRLQTLEDKKDEILHRDMYSSTEAKKITATVFTKEHPDMLLLWNPDMDYGVVENISVWNDIMCEDCGKNKGGYVLRDDHNAGTICEDCKEKEEGIQNTLLKSFKLPDNHDF